MHDGVPTRYIPSLDGGLYRYDGESIEAVPMTAETLLSASFKLADDTVMIGGKDLLTYGLNPQTGQVCLKCMESPKTKEMVYTSHELSTKSFSCKLLSKCI